jgi:hypothetical protein
MLALGHREEAKWAGGAAMHDPTLKADATH